MNSIGCRVEDYLALVADDYRDAYTTLLDGAAQWMYLDQEDVCVCIPHKNGGTAFREKLCELRGWTLPKNSVEVMLQSKASGHGPFLPSEVEERFPDTPHYLSVRYPVNRFGSLWRSKCRDGNDIVSAIVGMTPDELMDYIESHPDSDRHWMRQSRYLTSTTTCIPYRELFSRLGWEYESKNSTISNSEAMPASRILEFYSDDYQLWLKLS